MPTYSRLYIDGRWTESASAQQIDIINPATEGIIGHVPAGGPEDIDLAVGAAKEALSSWASTTPEIRAGYLKRVHEELVARGPELAELITSEMGMPIKLSQGIQAGLPAQVLNSYVELLGEYAFSERIGHSLVLKEPAGVVAAITPWNYPLHQLMIKVAAALAAGCTVVAKPSEIAPLSAFVLAEIFAACGLPPGVFNLVSGYGSEAGEALAGHPDVDLVTFTGSTRVGKRIMSVAASSVKRTALELGGKSAAIVLDDADLEIASKVIVNNCFLNSGQTCSAQTRLLVPEYQYEEAVRLACEVAQDYLPGSPLDIKTKMGPLVSEQQRERVLHYIHQGMEAGAELLCGGPDAPEGLPLGYYVQPTVFGKVLSNMEIAQEEIFGPVLCIMTYQDEEDAVRIANSTKYGLSGAVWSASAEHAERIARRLQTGQVDINGGRFNLLAPFGGYKQSGYGRELGRYGLEGFLQLKSLQFRVA